MKWSAATLSPTNKKEDDNEQNTLAIFYPKKYNLLAAGNVFIIKTTFVITRGTPKGTSSD